MSSMRNAVQRRNHKERAQPQEREHRLGLLEKHKDYSLRAKDYNAKKARLKILREKAALRNEDEFSFAMYSSKTHDRGQKLADRGNQVLSHDAVKLLKTQDAGYLKTLAQQTRRARDKLEKGFILQEGKGVKVRGQDHDRSDASKIVFVDNVVEQQQFDSSSLLQKRSSSQVNSRPDLEESQEAEQTGNPSPVEPRSRRSNEIEENALKQARLRRKQRKRAEETQGSRLKALRSREKELLAAERELELQRAKMSNSVGGVNKAGVKWKVRERKR